MRGKYAGSLPAVPVAVPSPRSSITCGRPSSAARTGNHSSKLSPTSMRVLPGSMVSAGRLSASVGGTALPPVPAA